ncbi:hypothetical protein [Bailinhaonella thermotolerans]|uniref:Uncharacterized protein n=1 Tax=Bailinhaonella thermotolerans TaxID=1070861 RepID=A0A3A3ZXD5_9ACTN|nr:hypothetical protein [Bailinhaonella thermotolerans]RJL19568.1 hypothetical protein D5H75_40210 [Bailinhaonella thermotolerans]
MTAPTCSSCRRSSRGDVGSPCSKTREHIAPDNLHAEGGSSITLKTARDYHLFAGLTVEGLAKGEPVRRHFSRFDPAADVYTREIHAEDRVGTDAPLSTFLATFDVLDTKHRIRFRTGNPNPCPVAVTESQFRVAI